MQNLTLTHRQQLQRLLDEKVPKKVIAEVLQVSISTIYREIKRNTIHGKYIPETAHQLYLARKKVIGGLPKSKKPKSILPKPKKNYVLYADRRTIYWFSDTPHQRSKYNIIPFYTGHKYQHYHLQSGLEKIHHYKHNIPLFQLLLSTLERPQKMHKKVTTKVIHFTPSPLYYYTQTHLLLYQKAA